MQIGESSKPIRIESKLLWKDTGINLVAGQQYHFKSTGEWTDGNIPPGFIPVMLMAMKALT